MALDFVLVLFYIAPWSVFKEVFMNARVKRVTAAQVNEAVDGDSDWIVVGVVKSPIWRDGKVEGFIRHIIVDRKEDLQRQLEATAECNRINKAIASDQHQTT